MSVFVNHNGIEKEVGMLWVNHNGVDKLVAGGTLILVAPPENLYPSPGQTGVIYGSFEGSGYYSLYNRPQKSRQVRISLSPSMMPLLWDSGPVIGAQRVVSVDFRDIEVPFNTPVYWQMRYQDVDDVWSPWSSPTHFVTASTFIPTVIGEKYGGGFYFGNLDINGEPHALVIADKQSEAKRGWGTNVNTNARDRVNSKENTDTIISVIGTSYAAGYCRAYRGGGLDDWDFPAIDVWSAVAWSNIRPNGSNTPQLFKTGGAQALSADPDGYWSSTEAIASTARFLRFDGGSESAKSKNSSSAIVRPIRAVKI